MSFYNTVNNASSVITIPHINGDGVLHVNPISVFGSGGFPIRVTCVRQSDSAVVIYAIGSSGATTLNITGVLEGTSDIDLAVNDICQADITAGALRDIHDAINSINTSGATAVSGPSGVIPIYGNTGLAATTVTYDAPNNRIVVSGIKVSNTSGLLKAANGVVSAASNNIDYLTPNGNGSGIINIQPSNIFPTGVLNITNILATGLRADSFFSSNATLGLSSGVSITDGNLALDGSHPIFTLGSNSPTVAAVFSRKTSALSIFYGSDTDTGGASFRGKGGLTTSAAAGSTSVPLFVSNGGSFTTNNTAKLLLGAHGGYTITNAPYIEGFNDTSDQSTGVDSGIRFATFNGSLAVRMTLAASGNLGIGFPKPAEKLEVNGVSKSNGLRTNIVTKSAAYTITNSDDWILGDASGGIFTLTLPNASSVGDGREFTVKKIDSSVNIITLATTGGQNIDGVTSQSLSTQWQSFTVKSFSGNWYIQ
jgi:hypothetical protein